MAKYFLIQGCIVVKFAYNNIVQHLFLTPFEVKVARKLNSHFGKSLLMIALKRKLLESNEHKML